MILIFDAMGRLGQIGSNETPCKIFTLGTEIEKSAGGVFTVFIIKQSMQKNVFAGYFPTEHNARLFKSSEFGNGSRML